MATRTKSVSGFPQFQSMRLMAITTCDPSVIHLALQKRSVDIHFILNLSVLIVQPLFKEGGQMRFKYMFPMLIIIIDGPTPRMAPGTGVYLGM